jgi:pimeloyl-ACP methyl ester carboxylesterase
MRVFRFVPIALLLYLLIGCTSGIPVVETYPEANAHRIEVDGVEVHYFDFNADAGGTPVLFIHGYSGCGFEAFFLTEHLPGIRLIAPDLPGAGWSKKPATDYTSEYYLDFIRAFSAAIGIETCHLVGHSMGGQLAAMYAAASGARDRSRLAVESLVLIAPFGLDGEAGPVLEFLAGAGVLVDYGFVLHSETIIELAIRLNVFHDPTLIPRDYVDYLEIATFHTDGAIDALAGITRNIIAGPSIGTLLPEITAPTLVVWGADDRVLDFTFAADFYAAIPNCTVAAIPDCGHLPHVERPELTAKAITKFLATTERR